MRQLLDTIYRAAGALAAVFIVLIALLILAQIVGRWFDILVPSTEDFSGFFLAASSFLALAYTLQHDSHIRVTLVLQHIRTGQRRVLELLVLVLAIALIAYASWWTTLLVIESWEFEEVTSGYVPVPLWIPQTPMALGLIILLVALVDRLVCLLVGESMSGHTGEEN